MKFTTSSIYVFFILLRTIICSAQVIPEKGIPKINTYFSGNYQINGKTWDIKTALNGITYFATDDGLLEFDGKFWNTYKGSNGNTRSLFIENDSLIYTGSDLDFGVFTKSGNTFKYKSLYPYKNDIPEEKEEFWNVFKINKAIVYISSTNLYCHSNNQITKIPAPNKFESAFYTNNTLYLIDKKNGIYTFNGKKLVSVYPNVPQDIHKITGIINQKDFIIVTKSQGLFKFNNNSNTFENYPFLIADQLKSNQVFSFQAIDTNYWVFGTILNGLYITNSQGKIIQHINNKKGLPNNTILSLNYAKGGNLWLGMDYGLASLPIFSSTSFFYDYNGNFGTPNNAKLLNDILYLGSNQGLYTISWNNLNNNSSISQNFKLIKGTEGQVWSLASIHNQLYACHDKGLFGVINNQLKPIFVQQGVYCLAEFNSNYVISGNYNGISIFKKENKTLTYQKNAELIYGSCTQIFSLNKEEILVNIPNYAIIKVRFDNKFRVIDRKIFPSNSFKGSNPVLFTENNNVYLKTSQKTYQYFPNKIAFTTVKNSAEIKALQDKESLTYFAEKLNDNYSYYPIHNGFALVNKQPKNKNEKQYPIVFRNITVYNNDTIQQIFSEQKVKFALNNFKINFFIPQNNTATYQYRLLPKTKEWSTLSTKTEIDFLNLAEGYYTFEVKSTINGDTVQKSFSFEIAPPWYRSFYSYFLYFIGAFATIFFFRKWQQKKLKKQKFEMLKKEQNSLRKQAQKFQEENLLIKQNQLEYEKVLLSNQLKEKTVELAKQAKENEDKNRILFKVKEKIESLQHTESPTKQKWNELNRLLDSYLEIHNDHTFEIQIDELHQEFFTKMKEKYPDLSLYDLRLCAYLKLGFNSKEIADMLQVLPSSINVSRSRLRKKLNLSQDEDLFDFLKSI